MSSRESQPPSQELFASVEAHARQGDFYVAAQVACEQDLVQPINVVGYLARRWRHSFDADQAQLWRSTLHAYIGVTMLLPGLFRGEDEDEFQRIKEHVSFDDVMRAQYDAVPDTLDNNWDRATFAVDLPPAMIRRVRNLEYYKSALNAYGQRVSDYSFQSVRPALNAGLEILSTHEDRPLYYEARSLFDEAVNAQVQAAAGGKSRRVRKPEPGVALSLATDFASSDIALARMRRALDEPVFKHARDQLSGMYPNSNGSDEEFAIETIQVYASTPGRAYAMRKQLGLV